MPLTGIDVAAIEDREVHVANERNRRTAAVNHRHLDPGLFGTAVVDIPVSRYDKSRVHTQDTEGRIHRRACVNLAMAKALIPAGISQVVRRCVQRTHGIVGSERGICGKLERKDTRNTGRSHGGARAIPIGIARYGTQDARTRCADVLAAARVHTALPIDVVVRAAAQIHRIGTRCVVRLSRDLGQAHDTHEVFRI